MNNINNPKEETPQELPSVEDFALQIKVTLWIDEYEKVKSIKYDENEKNHLEDFVEWLLINNYLNDESYHNLCDGDEDCIDYWHYQNSYYNLIIPPPSIWEEGDELPF